MSEIKRVYIQKTPKESEARYVALSNTGQVLRAYNSLADISADYKIERKMGLVEFVRQLDRTYNPQSNDNQTI